jgi:hypothetical protein
MRTIRDHQSGDLFDPWEHLGDKRLNMLKRSWAGVFRAEVFPRLPIAALAPHFDASQGRPSKDLYAAVGALVLQQLHDLTDGQTVEALAFNLSWHYALDIRDERDVYLCERTLRNYRRLLVEQQLDAVLFESITDGLIRAYGVATDKQRIDSTRVRSNMRSLTRLGILVETIGKLLRELKRRHRALYGQLDAQLIERYVGRGGKGCFDYAKPTQARRQLDQAAQDLWTLKVHLAGGEAAQLDSYAIAARVFDEQCEAPPQAAQGAPVRVREPKEVPADAVINPADPDACYKTPQGVGYGVQVMETYEEYKTNRPADQPANKADEKAEAPAQDEDGAEAPDKPLSLITHVEIHALNEYDGDHLQPALDRTAGRGVGPRTVLGDTHYGALERVDRAAQDGVEVVAPAQPARKTGGDQSRLALEDFELDDPGNITRCAAGHAPKRTSIAQSGTLLAVFDHATCWACPLRQRCCVKQYKRFKDYHYQYTPARVRNRARRLHEREETFKARYRWRAGVEAAMSHLKHDMGLGALRVRGMKAMSYAVYLRTLGLNIRRCAAWQARQARGGRPKPAGNGRKPVWAAMWAWIRQLRETWAVSLQIARS